MAASIIAIGNPGAGKSTILNSLAGELLFKAGVSIGSGLTYQLDEKENNRGRFYDTPGLSDDTVREAAGKAISTGLRKGGPFKLLFFVRTESGRLVHEDITTFKLVLESAPEIGNKYGIVSNKLPKNVAKLLQNPENGTKMLTHLFAKIPEHNRCAPSNITYLPYKPEADAEENHLLDLDSLKTLEGLQFKDFVYGEVPTVQLTPGAAKDIETGNYDQMTKLIETLEKKMESDKKMFEAQKGLLLKQLEKAKKEKEKQSIRDREMFEMMKEHMENTLEFERQKYQNQQSELAQQRQKYETQQWELAQLRAKQSEGSCIIL